MKRFICLIVTMLAMIVIPIATAGQYSSGGVGKAATKSHFNELRTWGQYGADSLRHRDGVGMGGYVIFPDNRKVAGARVDVYYWFGSYWSRVGTTYSGGTCADCPNFGINVSTGPGSYFLSCYKDAASGSTASFYDGGWVYRNCYLH